MRVDKASLLLHIRSRAFDDVSGNQNQSGVSVRNVGLMSSNPAILSIVQREGTRSRLPPAGAFFEGSLTGRMGGTNTLQKLVGGDHHHSKLTVSTVYTGQDRPHLTTQTEVC